MGLETGTQKTLYRRSLPYLQLFIAIISVSFSAIIVVYLIDLGVPPAVTAMYRTFFAGIGALILSLYNGLLKRTQLKDIIGYFFLVSYWQSTLPLGLYLLNMSMWQFLQH